MTNSKNYIGVFDSGIGGLTVVRSIMNIMPDENIIYFGDTARVPYGTKSEKQIREFASNDVRFLDQFEPKALMIACNTADSVARETLEREFDLPIYGVIEPASRKAASVTKNNRIGIMATAATVRSGAYTKMIEIFNRDAQVFPLACPLLVPLVENGRFSKDDIVVTTILKEYIDQLTVHDVDTIVLGCTHYPLLMDAIKSIVPEINVISSSDAAAEALYDSLRRHGLLNEGKGGKHRYYVSDDAESFSRNASIFLDEDLDGEVDQVRI
jgi:glutamate racemase